MHKLRGQAKHSAWYDSPDDDTNIKFPIRNPFGKYRSNTTSRSTTLHDEENGMSGGIKKLPTNPEDAGAAERRNDLGVHSPPHAQTTPNASSSRKPKASDDVHIPVSDSPRNSMDGITEDKTRTQTFSTENTNGHPPETEKAVIREREPKKRSMKDKITGKNKEDDGDNGKSKHKFTVANQIRATLFSSWINILLIFSPVGIAVYYAHVDPVAVFIINFIAIIPLAAMLSYATEEIALRTGEVIGGLLNASFGNAVELIVSIIALTKNQILIVQTSLIGSILSNLLLVMGMCFFFGGINRLEQSFNVTVAQTAASLLFLAVSSLIIPTAFDEFARIGNLAQSADPENPKPHVAQLSRGTAILLLIVYGCYLFFQLKSHIVMFSEPSAKAKKRNVGGKLKNAVVPGRFRRSSVQTPENADEEEEEEDKEPEKEEPNLSLWVAIGTLAASTVLVALNAEYLVDSINAVTCRGGSVSKNFVGLILLPIVGNAAEHATAVTVAIKDKMDLAIGVAVGSSLQIALLVIPFVVVLGWIIGKDDMTLLFDGFQIAVLFVAVLLVNYLIQDGKSHWLEGVLLLILYIIIAVAAWFYPTSADECGG